MRTIALPDSPEVLEAMLADGRTLAALSDSGGLGDFVSAYARTVQVKDKGIKHQETEQLRRIVSDMLGAADMDPARAPELVEARARVQRARIYSPTARGAAPALAGLFTSLPDMLRAIHHTPLAEHATVGAKARMDTLRNYSEQVPGEGGFLVPEEFRAGVLSVSLEQSVVRPRATVIPMGGPRVKIPKNDSTTNSGSVYGGVQTYWVEESADLPESQASFGLAVLDAKKQVTWAEAPNELIKDAPAFEVFMGMSMPGALAFSEDVALIKGSGVGEPFGMLHPSNPALVVVPRITGQGSTVVVQNVAQMFSRLLPESLGKAVWLVSPDVFPELVTMGIAIGTGGQAVWLNGGNVIGAPAAMIFGRPVVLTQKAPGLLGQQGDISLVDPSFMLLGDRQAMTAESSRHFRFKNDRTSYKVVQRLDGRPWLDSAITPQNGGPGLSPFVTLGIAA